ncbi:MAG: AmmeMemoRadiSam system radical SAM enzyme, partial [Pirellulales bacterium]|nr:AmmeMemoRadiSam system radical SAM enzyme [Pirellulales bacterium]
MAAKQVDLPPDEPAVDGMKTAGWWHEDASGRVVCDVCPRGCVLGPDDRGFCFVRQNRAGRMVSTTYGRSTGFCIDPIEKKPLHHFFPGTAVLSFGTAGCNLGCKFCQNWTSSKSREVDRFCQEATPEAVAQAARQLGCKSVAFTYNDPIVWVEYAIDTARACREAGIQTVAVTSGYMSPAARKAFYSWIDAANVDLKAMDDEFYHKLCAGRLEPVLDTLRWLVHETDVWVEITNLVIPRENDSLEAIRRLCDWVAEELSPDVPLHFSAFHPDFRMTDRERTPLETLITAHDLARAAGLKYVYTGNVPDPSHQTTYCPGCGEVLIQRDGYELGVYALKENRCGHCGVEVAGRFDASPGDWGSRRQPVRIADFARPDTTSGLPKKGATAGLSSSAMPKGPDNTAGQASSGTQLPKSQLDQQAASSPIAPSDPTPREERPMVEQPTPTPEGAEAGGRPLLDDAQQQQVFHVAAARVVATVNVGTAAAVESLPAEVAGRPVLGAFVSLKRAGQLRSCCGFMGDSVPLGEAVDRAAIRAAKDD